MIIMVIYWPYMYYKNMFYLPEVNPGSLLFGSGCLVFFFRSSFFFFSSIFLTFLSEESSSDNLSGLTVLSYSLSSPTDDVDDPTGPWARLAAAALLGRAGASPSNSCRLDFSISTFSTLFPKRACSSLPSSELVLEYCLFGGAMLIRGHEVLEFKMSSIVCNS